MPRQIILGVIVIAVLTGGLFLLSSMAREKPPVRVEKVVQLGNLQG